MSNERETGAVKHDTGKPMMGLIDSDFLEDLARVLSFGVKKYSAQNWRKGLELSHFYNALQRHAVDWNRGMDIDPESGLPTLSHLACELMFLHWLQKHRPDLDDRFKYLETKT